MAGVGQEGAGIVFKEVENPGSTIFVKSLAPGGPAEQSGLIEVGDALVKVISSPLSLPRLVRRSQLPGDWAASDKAACMLLHRRPAADAWA